MPRTEQCLLAVLAPSLLRCGGDAFTAATGDEGGNCFPNGTCNAGLECSSNRCVRGDGGLGATASATGGAGTSGGAGGNGQAGSNGTGGEAVDATGGPAGSGGARDASLDARAIDSGCADGGGAPDT